MGETPDSVLLEYQLSAVKADGTTLTGTRWIPSGTPRLLLGTRQVRDAIDGLEVASGTPVPPADSTVNR